MRSVKNIKPDTMQKYTKLTSQIEVLKKEEFYWIMRIYNRGLI